MKKKNILSIFSIMFIIVSSIFILTSCSGEKTYRVVKIFSYTGNCQVVRENNTLNVEKDMKLKNNDELQVSSNSNAILKLDNDKFVNVKENTNVKLEATGKENKTKTRLHVLNGGVIVEVKEKLKDKEAFEIASSNSVMAIRGTQISFDVEKTTDSITSTFSILKGETEIFLYKDENMDSTELIHDYMMSYTTSLIKSTDEIYKIYDSKPHKKLNDEELYETYGIKKKTISNDKINEMVKAVNDFEKEDEEIINGVLNFDIPTEIAYKTNPIDVIKILDDNRYIDLLNVKFLYSKTIDGSYLEFDSANPLSIGKWYCKVDAGNAYLSEPIEFSVIKANIDFTIGESVGYKTNPNTIISVNGSYDNLKYLYSSSIDGVYAEYNESNPLTTGIYYAKVENDYYTSTPKQFRVVQASINISLLNDSVSYKTNPSTIISVEGASGTLTYKYGTSRNNLNKTYSTSNPLSVGTWYVQVSSGTQYVSNIIEFNVVAAKLNATLSSDSVEYLTNPSSIITINGTYSNIKYLYSTTETGDFVEYDTENPFDVGFYYVKVVSGNEYISDILDFEITPKEITFTLGDSVIYGVNPSTIITITNGTYPNATYLYRKASSTTDLEFDSSNPFEVGTWYVTIDNGSNYSSSRKSFEIVQKEINYTLTQTTVPYGTNPNTIVSVSGTYPTIIYKYSTTETGTYNEFDTNNPLAKGTYFIKLFIDDNYYSVAKEFSVGNMSFDFTISSEIEYEDSIIDNIRVDSMYTDLTYYYSTSESFTTSNTLDDSTVLNPGTYYIKIYSGTMYESIIKSFEIVKANKDFTVPMGGRITYGEDITDSFDDSYNRNIYISTSQTGTFNLYNYANEYTPGTYYIKLENDYYTSTPKQLTILKLEVEFNMTYEQKMVDDEIHVTISVDDNEFFNSNYAKVKESGEYKYYITVTITNGTTGTYKFDYETREIEVTTTNNGFTATYSANMPITIIDYSFSEETYNYTPTNSFNVSNILMADNFISAEINIFVTSGTPSIKASYRVDDGEEYTESLFNSENKYYFTASGIITNSIVYIKYLFYVNDILVDETSYYTLDTSNFVSLEAGTDFTYTEPREASSLHTFNDDGTVNIYYDLGFVNNTDYNLVCEITYGTYSMGEIDYYYNNQKIVYTSSPILELLDLPFNKYAICGFRILNVVDGINYVVFDDEEDYDMDLVRPLFTGGNAISADDYDNDGEYDLSASDAYVLEEDGVCTVTVKLIDYDDNVYQEIVFTEYPDNEVQVNTCDVTESDLFVIVSYTRISIMTTDLLNKLLDASYSTTQKLTDTLFNQVKQAFETKYGITVKGNNTLVCNNHTSFSPQEY